MLEMLIVTKLKRDHFIRDYFGDFLVAILVYCSVLAFWKLEPKLLALDVFIFTCLIEVA